MDLEFEGIQPIMAVWAAQQEFEVVGHTANTVRKQSVDGIWGRAMKPEGPPPLIYFLKVHPTLGQNIQTHKCIRDISQSNHSILALPP